ncbi:MAG: aspartyl protease family protein [Candidatus Eremiobacteraeota bacterium]|nr:aspartyl protease family protein [Candidatus Eremiobacteraeota bacterium]
MNRASALRAFALALGLGLTAAALPAASSAAPDDIVAVLRMSGAALGVSALASIRTLHLRGTITVIGVDGTADGWQDMHDGAFAQYADAGPASAAQGFDGTHAWNRDASGYVWNDGSAQARYAALDQVYLNRYLLWRPDHGGAAVASRGQRVVNGHRYDVLQVAPSGSLPFDVWIDATTHLPARTVQVIGVSTITTTFGDYRSVHGLRVPFLQTSDADGNAAAFHAKTAVVDDPGAAVALRRPNAQVSDFALPSGTTTIPFELVDGHVVLPVTINGKGPFQFIFDTGGQNVIDADVAKAVGLGSAGNAAGGGVGAATEAFQFATVDMLGVGDATLRKQIFGVLPVHAGFGMSSGKPVDGLIGFEVLARFVTTFDYGKNQVVLRTSPAPDAGGTTIPFVFNGQHMMIDCAIGGVAGPCIIDTGSRSALSITSPFLAAHPTLLPANATAVGANGFGVGGASLGKLGRTSLQLAGFTVPDVIADYSTQTRGAFADPFYAGNVGAPVLKRFAVTFDYTNQRATFVPNANFAEHETYDRSGTFLVTQGGKIIVADVRPGTPAADAGLARGDVLTTVGGKDAGTLGLAAIRDLFRGAPGTALPLGVAGKDGAVRAVTLTLKDYV